MTGETRDTPAPDGTGRVHAAAVVLEKRMNRISNYQIIRIGLVNM